MLYVDVDAFCKLAHWNILPLLADFTGYEWHEIATMTSLRFRALKAFEKPDGKIFHTSAAAKIACNCIEIMGHLPQPSLESLALFESVPQVDIGEAVLFSLAVDDPTGQLLTGDKRALRALSHTSCTEQLSNRVFTLEQILLLCLETMGEPWFKANICPFKFIDKSINIVMGSQCNNTETNIKEGLNSYIHEIRRLCTPPLLRLI